MNTDERARLAALRRYRILDTEPERAFDDLTLLASQICGTPIALLTLVDTDRQWFKSRIGIPVVETARSVAFCAHAIRQPDLFIVQDTHDDDRFRKNPFVVSAPHIRFYAGAPLVTPDGFALGTLCVADSVPRTLTDEQRRALEALRRQAVGQLELRRNLFDLREALEERDRAEAEQARLISELKAALDNVRKLTALMPFCSACELNIVIPADPWSIPTVTEGLKQVLENKGWNERSVYELELAVQEALANAIRHGCRDDPGQKVQCIVTCDESGEIGVVVRDPGAGFEPGTVANPLDEANILKGSGRGIFLINTLMDDVHFEDGGREIRMRKRGDKQG